MDLGAGGAPPQLEQLDESSCFFSAPPALELQSNDGSNDDHEWLACDSSDEHDWVAPGSSDEHESGDRDGAVEETSIPGVDNLVRVYAGSADDSASGSRHSDLHAVSSPPVAAALNWPDTGSDPVPERQTSSTDTDVHSFNRPSCKRTRQVEDDSSGGARARSAIPRIDASILGLRPPLPTRSTVALSKELACALLTDERCTCCGPRPDFIDAHDDSGKIFVERSSGRPPLARVRRTRGLDTWVQKQALKMQKIEQVTIGGHGEVWLQTHYGFLHRRGDGLKPLKFHQYQLLYFHRGRAPLPAKSTAHSTVEPDWVQGTLYHINIHTESEHQPNVEEAKAVASPVQGVLELKLSQVDNRWIQLIDAQGTDAGALLNGEHGPSLVGSSGDFAEYYPREPGECVFEEGELVAIGENGLTRNTKGAKQLAVITRRAIVVGSRPKTSELALYDVVAHSGRVPIRLRGTFRYGDYVVPSGHSDGTAVAIPRKHLVSVGRVEANHIAARNLDKQCSFCRRFEVHEPWALVPITVISPAQTVSEAPPCQCIKARHSLMAVAFLIAGALLCVWCIAGGCRAHCEQVMLPHGTLRGVCDGSPGSMCIYDRCDVGYKLVPVHAHALLQTGVDTWHRKCDGRTGAAYSGTEMQCVVRSCPSETIVVGSQTCNGCSERDAAANFPHTSAGSNSTVYINCPTGFTGRLRRICTVEGWGRISGSCSRLRCPRLQLPLSGRPRTTRVNIDDVHACLDDSRGDSTRTGSVARPSFFCQAVLYHTLTTNETAEGDKVKISCPRPSYSGTVIAECIPNSTDWNISGHCTRMVCPTEWENLSFADGHLFRIRLPQQQRMNISTDPPGLTPYDIASKSSVPTWKVAPCCSHYSNTGSCLDEQGAFGYIVSRCDESGRRHIASRFNSSIAARGGKAQCVPRSMIRMKLDQPKASAEKLYQMFFENVGAATRSGTARDWSLPAHGVLTTVSAALEAAPGTADASMTEAHDLQNLWLPIVSAKSDGPTSSLHSGTIYTDSGNGRQKHSAGRSVGAFANVSCRQFGFRQAVAVTNCKGLHDLEIGSEPTKRSPVFEALCPEVGNTSHPTDLCPTWLEVRASTDSASPQQWDWLRFIAQNRGSAMDQPYELFSVDNTFFGPLPPLSSCSGKETHLADCFHAQVNRMLRTKISTHNRPCMHKLIVACSGKADGTDVDVASQTSSDLVTAQYGGQKVGISALDSPAVKYGTWVIGDQPATQASTGPPSSLVAPKIFSGFGVYNCTTGKELADDDPLVGSAIAQANPAQLCWGKAIKAVQTLGT